MKFDCIQGLDGYIHMCVAQAARPQGLALEAEAKRAISFRQALTKISFQSFISDGLM